MLDAITWQGWASLIVAACCLLVVARTRFGADLVLFGGVVCLLSLGVIDAPAALSGFANPAVATIAMLYVIAAGIQETGGTEWFARRILGRPNSVRQAVARLVLPTTIVSAFVNNTPVVATLIPAVTTWAKRVKISPSKLLMPMSYGAIMGGACTLIGTSTNLVVNGLYVQTTGQAGLNMFSVAWVGVPVALVGMAYLIIFSGRLPERKSPGETFANPKEYTVEMRVDPDGPMVNKTVLEAGLRHLPGLFLVEIERSDRIVPSVGSNERLLANDHLVFAGQIDSVAELRAMPGLLPAAHDQFSLSRDLPELSLVEVAVAPQSDLVGKTIKAANFRMAYGASVLAVARNGKRIKQKIGDIQLRPSDTLLLETRQIFFKHHKHSKDFLMVSEVNRFASLRHSKAPIAWSVLAAVIVVAAIGWLSILNAAMLGAAIMLVSGCVSTKIARSSIDVRVLLAIASAFGIATAIITTGAAQVLAGAVVQTVGQNPLALLAAVYLLTWLMTELLTNNAAAALMFPLVVGIAEQAGMPLEPLLITLMMAASSSFITPMGYQTNLMVYGPGGYHFGDYVRFGLPLNIIALLGVVLIVPVVWPLTI